MSNGRSELEATEKKRQEVGLHMVDTCATCKNNSSGKADLFACACRIHYIDMGNGRKEALAVSGVMVCDSYARLPSAFPNRA